MLLDNNLEPTTTVSEILKRWEVYRVRYNVILFVSIVVMYTLELVVNVKGDGYWVVYWQDVLLCLLVANVAFSSVYLVEFWVKYKTRDFLSIPVSQRLYNYGLWFSIVIIVLTGIVSILINE